MGSVHMSCRRCVQYIFESHAKHFFVFTLKCTMTILFTVYARYYIMNTSYNCTEFFYLNIYYYIFIITSYLFFKLFIFF